MEKLIFFRGRGLVKIWSMSLHQLHTHLKGYMLSCLLSCFPYKTYARSILH